MSSSDRFAAVYLKSTACHLISNLLTDFASRVGLSLTFPGTQSVILLTEYGEQWSASLPEFEVALQGDAVVRFQLWWNDSDDLYCRVERKGTVVGIELALDGTSDEQEQKVIQALKQMFALLAGKCVAWALVIDRSGATADRSWADIVTGRSPLRLPFPDVVLFPASSPCLRAVDHQNCRISKTGPNVIEILPLS